MPGKGTSCKKATHTHATLRVRNQDSIIDTQHYVIDNLAGANDPTLKFGNKLSYDTSILKMDHNEKDYDPSSIVLGVLRKMSRLRYWDVTSLSVQLKNTTRNI